MNCSRSTGALSFFVGGAVGAGLALLYAPQSGPATRALLRRKTRASADALASFKARALRSGEKLKHEAEQLGSAIRAGVEEELDNAQREVATLKASVERSPSSTY